MFLILNTIDSSRPDTDSLTMELGKWTFSIADKQHNFFLALCSRSGLNGASNRLFPYEASSLSSTSRQTIARHRSAAPKSKKNAKNSNSSRISTPSMSSAPSCRRTFVTTSSRPLKKQKMVILGSGWASFRILKSLDFSLYDVTVVSPRNHFFFTPMLASTTTGVLEFRSIMESIRTTSKKFSFVQGQARSINFESRELVCSEWMDSERRFNLPYDKLIIGVGADNNTFGIPGVTPRVDYNRAEGQPIGNVFFLKELADARAIRNQIINNLEQASFPGISAEEKASLLNFVVVGGGPTGVEFAAELSDFFWADVLSNFPSIKVNELKITLLEAGDTILSAFSKTLVEQAMKNIKRQGIDMRLHTRVKEVKPNKIILDDGSTINCGMIVWSTGVGPRKFVREIGQNLENGRLVVDDHLRLSGHEESIYALGDCAVIRGNPLPATAQVANQQATYLVKVLNGKGALDKATNQTKPFVYYPLGLMAYVGAYKSVFDTNFFKGTGLLEFLAWRSVYLTRLGGWKNKMMVPYNWLKTLIWGRDVSGF